MLRLAFDFIIAWREIRARPNAYTWDIKSLPFPMDYLAAKYRLSSYKMDIIVASYGCFPLILH